MYANKLCFIDTSVVIIGFDPATYQVNETGGTVTLTVKVLKGTIKEGSIPIRVTTVDDSAQGMNHSCYVTGTYDYSYF